MTDEERLKELEKYMAPGYKTYKDPYHSGIGLQPIYCTSNLGSYDYVSVTHFKGYQEIPFVNAKSEIGNK